MHRAVVIARVLLGFVFAVFGLDFFFHFLPPLPGQPSAAGNAFLEALLATGYLFPLIKGIEITAGLLLMAGFLVPLALALLGPIVLNIFLFHLVLDHSGLVLAVAIALLEAFLLYAYRDAFRGLLAFRAESREHSAAATISRSAATAGTAGGR
jgi:putative oxidoreductase